MFAEKSGNGYEEGQCKGSDHDDIGFVGPVHLPLYLSILHLVIEMGPVSVLFVHEKRSNIFLFRFKSNNRHAFNYSVKCKSFCAMYVSGRLQKVLIVMKMGSNVFQIYSRILILDTLDYVNDASDIRCLNHFLLHVLSIYCLSLHIHLMGDTRQSCSGIN